MIANVAVVGLEDLLASELSKFEAKVQSFAGEIRNVFQESVSASTQFKDRSGNLRAIITDQSPGTLTFRAWTDYASYIEFGRGPVFPIQAKCLRWISPGGAVVFRKSAGPSRPRPFMKDAKDAVLARYHSIWESL